MTPGYYRSSDGSVFHILESEDSPFKACKAVKLGDYALSPKITSLPYAGFGIYELSYTVLVGLKAITESEFSEDWAKLVAPVLKSVARSDGACWLNFKNDAYRSRLLRACMTYKERL